MNIQQFHRACFESGSKDSTLAALRQLRPSAESSEADGSAIDSWPKWASVETLAAATSKLEPWPNWGRVEVEPA